MADCTDLPTKHAKEAIEKTRNTGKEHAFVMCDGEVEDTFVGDENSLEFETDCAGSVVVFHTHPNDTLQLSPQDREVLEDSNIDVQLMCVGDTEGNYICEGEGYACAVDIDEYDVDPDALAEPPSAAVCGQSEGEGRCN